jgi:N-acetylneuraminic acid mutarotase
VTHPLRLLIIPALAALAGCASESAPVPADAAVSATDADVPGDAATEADACVSSSTQPQARADSAGVVDPTSGEMFMFGGDVGPVVSCVASPAFSDETWRFDPRCGRWTQLSPAAHPSARARTAYALDARRRRMLMFGGRSREGTGGAYTVFRELWSLDLATGAWTMTDVQADGPTARANATLTVDEASDAAVLFGGNTSTDGGRFTPRNDTWRLDLGTLQWSRVASTRSPPARQFHAAALVAGGVLMVGGGDANAFLGPFLRDAWRLDIASGQWSQVALADDGDALQGRISHGLVARADGAVLLGGHDDGALGNRNDVLTLDAAGGVALASEGDTLQTPGRGFCNFPADFARIEASSPERRSAFTLAADPARQRVIIYGGKTDCGTAGDVWSLDLRTLTWTVLRDSNDGLSCGRTGRESCRGLCG